MQIGRMRSKTTQACAVLRGVSLLVVLGLVSHCGGAEEPAAMGTHDDSRAAQDAAPAASKPIALHDEGGAPTDDAVVQEGSGPRASSSAPGAASGPVAPDETSADDLQDDASGGNTLSDAGASEQQACRYYFESVCARIRECEAPTFRPCESPADLCPDILFGADSPFTVDAALECAATWQAHRCDDLMIDIWPACSSPAGARENGQACAFDAQCQSSTCGGGVVPNYNLSCGQCQMPASAGSVCGEQMPCARGLRCVDGLCVAIRPPAPQPPAVDASADAGSMPPVGFVRPACNEDSPCIPGQECKDGYCSHVETDPLPLGTPCSEFTECQPGMVCGIELVEAEASEPQVGTCQLLAPIGQPCIPTFSRLGRCEEGGTCNSRPSGECIPLREIGESCGYSQCVDGAYCQAYSIIDDEPSHTCYASRVEGRRCYDIDYICEEGLLCLCPAEDCDLALESTCARPAQLGGACDERMRCAAGLNCANAVCESPPEPPQPVLPAAFGEQCERTVRFGRIDGNCETDVEGAECLCADAQCAQAYCALPSLGAESCNGQTEICRAGFVCENEICVELASQQIEMQSCNP